MLNLKFGNKDLIFNEMIIESLQDGQKIQDTKYGICLQKLERKYYRWTSHVVNGYCFGSWPCGFGDSPQESLNSLYEQIEAIKIKLIKNIECIDSLI